MFPVVILMSAIGVSVPSSSGPYPDVNASDEAAREARFEHDAASVAFEHGQAILSEGAKDSIARLIASARAAGRLGVVHVASWSDEESPQPSSTKLSKAQIELADARADVVEAYLRTSLNVGTVNTYNLAKGAGRLAAAFNTPDAELKEILAGERDAPKPNTRVELLMFRDLGAPSTVVLVVEHRWASSAAKLQ